MNAIEPARRVPAGTPAIPAALRNDWCTPENALEPVYEILGDIIDIDPCSNAESIVKAKTAICLPPGADETQQVGGLVVPWHEHGTFFCNPPFGDGVVNLWVIKAILEASLGAEGIMLLPAYVSAYFFDDIWKAAQVICFWGKPGDTPSRVRFIGAKDSATFPIMLAYFGPKVTLAADRLERVGQIVPPWVVHAWLRMVRGQVIPGFGDVDDRTLLDPIYAAWRRTQRSHYDELIHACAADSKKTIGELVQEDSPLIDRILGLTVGEIGGGLAALQASAPEPMAHPTQRRPGRGPRKKRLSAGETPPQDERQLLLVPPGSKAERAREDLDRRILAVLREQDDGILSTELRKRVGCTPQRFRTAMKRLSDRGLAIRHGKTTTTRWYATAAHE